MLVEIKHEKFGDKLHTDTSSYVKICTQIRPRKSNVLFLEGRLFTFNKYNSPSHQSKQCTRTLC